ncbi:hypothetical protein [Ruegeria atlantica]|uniref:hypothetical protein n=1 Tax=Ruegeria atlantica TaxID=81569 RepID=UPI001480B325|nr:hypothetical protein [Ruegeria atlantica]
MNQHSTNTPRSDTPPDPPFTKIRQVEVRKGLFVTITVGYRSTDATEPCVVLFGSGVPDDSHLNWKYRDGCVMISWALENGVRLDQLSKFLREPEFETHTIEIVRKILQVVRIAPEWPDVAGRGQ